MSAIPSWRFVAPSAKPLSAGLGYLIAAVASLAFWLGVTAPLWSH